MTPSDLQDATDPTGPPTFEHDGSEAQAATDMAPCLLDADTTPDPLPFTGEGSGSAEDPAEFWPRMSRQLARASLHRRQQRELVHAPNSNGREFAAYAAVASPGRVTPGVRVETSTVEVARGDDEPADRSAMTVLRRRPVPKRCLWAAGAAMSASLAVGGWGLRTGALASSQSAETPATAEAARSLPAWSAIASADPLGDRLASKASESVVVAAFDRREESSRAATLAIAKKTAPAMQPMARSRARASSEAPPAYMLEW